MAKTKCIICGGEEWWTKNQRRYDSTMDETVSRFIGLVGFSNTSACPKHEVELAARLLRLDGV